MDNIPGNATFVHNGADMDKPPIGNLSDIAEVIIDGETSLDDNMPIKTVLPLLGQVATKMDLYYKPVITLIGLISNAFMVITLNTPELRTLSIASYYVALGVSDIIYLAASFLIWFHKVGVNVLHVNGLCQVLMYLTYTSNFISTWLLLSPVIERVALLCNVNCDVKKPSAVIGFVISLAVLFYTYILWTLGVYKGPMGTVCAPKEQYRDLTDTLFKIDSIANSLIPVVITVLCVSILLSATFSRTYRRYSRHRRLSHCRRDDNQKGRPGVLPLNTEDQDSQYMLIFVLVITISSYILTLPAAVERLKFLFRGSAGQKAITIYDIWRNAIFICIQLTSFSTKLLVCMFFSKLRRILYQNIRRCFKREDNDLGPTSTEELARITIPNLPTPT
ncbi:unnamed protein product [Owenia fusiformis]|uniref:Uncharacterized protein n=1 Tax=Owenia fusiformis TaxID=6347 RepID=A0A8J1XH44_OWEFU|nr:unnamed protein product [Owenia fusiformis]